MFTCIIDLNLDQWSDPRQSMQRNVHFQLLDNFSNKPFVLVMINIFGPPSSFITPSNEPPLEP